MSGKRIVIFIDGTWNENVSWNAPGLTNVGHLNQMLRNLDDQVSVYHSGLGTDIVSLNPGVEGFLERLEKRSKVAAFILGWPIVLYEMAFSRAWSALTGATGMSISRMLVRAYFYLASQYEPGDRVFIFGFSRGSFAARSFVGLLDRCGLLKIDPSLREDPKRLSECIERQAELAVNLYRRRSRPKQEEFRKQNSHPAFPVEMIGVFDTVGSLGLADSLLNVINPWHRRFHDTRLSPTIRAIYHAVSIDEHRWAFRPTLIDHADQADGQVVDEVWFAGDHADVGGGHHERGLSIMTLTWMLERAKRHGLEFDEDLVSQRLVPDYRLNGKGEREYLPVTAHESRRGFWRIFPNYLRRIREGGKIHRSVVNLRSAGVPGPRYAPGNLPPAEEVEGKYTIVG